MVASFLNAPNDPDDVGEENGEEENLEEDEAVEGLPHHKPVESSANTPMK